MLPLVVIGQLRIPSYSLAVAAGLILFTALAVLELKRIGKPRAVIIRTLLVSALSFVAMYLSAGLLDAVFHSVKNGRLTLSGITWEGGVIGGFTAFLLLSHWLVKEERGREIQLFSAVIPGIVLAHGIGRIGCFMGGCCFGQITEGPFGVVFPEGSPAARAYPNTQSGIGSFPVLPTQLFEAGFEFALFTVLTVFRRRLGEYALSVYLVFYSVFRFILELWRGDNRGATGMLLSPSQLMSILLFVWGVLIFFYQRGLIFCRREEKNGEINE